MQNVRIIDCCRELFFIVITLSYFCQCFCGVTSDHVCLIHYNTAIFLTRSTLRKTSHVKCKKVSFFFNLQAFCLCFGFKLYLAWVSAFVSLRKIKKGNLILNFSLIGWTARLFFFLAIWNLFLCHFLLLFF